MSSAVRLGFSVDVEDWPPSGIEPRIDSGIAGQLEKLLSVLDAAGARCTFFTVAELARREATLIRSIADHGHEIACHGLQHVDMGCLSRRAFASQVADARKVIEDIVGDAVVGFRAPFFRLPEPASTAREILRDAGYIYDSSARGRRPRASSDPIPVVAVSTISRFGRRLPFGSGFLVAFNRSSLERSIACEIKETGEAVFYMHPYNLGGKNFGYKDIVGSGMASYIRHSYIHDLLSPLFRRNLNHVLRMGRWVPLMELSLD